MTFKSRYADFSPFLINLADIDFLLLQTFSKLAMLDAFTNIDTFLGKWFEYAKIFEATILKSALFKIFFRINDRVISANNISLEGVDYATAVQVLRDSGQSVNLVVKRRLVLPPSATNNNTTQQHQQIPQQTQSVPLNNNNIDNNNQETTSSTSLKTVTLSKNNRKKDEFGLVLGCKIYIKEILHPSLADKESDLQEGDFINSINGMSIFFTEFIKV